MHRRLWLLPFALVLTLTLAFGAACGDDDDDGIDDEVGDVVTEVTGGDETPSDGAETPAGGAETPADGAETPAAGGDAGSTEIDIAAENEEEFTESDLSAPAGTVTVVFENQDQGVTHNFALYDSPDSASDLIDATELLPGPATEEVTFDDLEAGEYYYNCQVHPAMEGVLTVE